MDFTKNITKECQPWHNRLAMCFIILVLIIMFSVELLSGLQENQTIDEGAHLVAGFSYLTTGIYALNREHPPLVKLIAAIPLLKTKINYQPAQNWDEGTQWSAAYTFLYSNTLPADFLLLLGRLPGMFASILLGLIIFFWSKRRAGIYAGLFTLTLYAFDPNIIAHARYITTDLPLGLAFTATILSFLWYVERPTHYRLILTGFVFGIAQVTKFSAILLGPLLILFFLIYVLQYTPKNKRRTLFMHQGVSLLITCAVGTLIAILITYGFAIPVWRENLHLPLLSNSIEPFTKKNISYVLQHIPVFHLYLDGLFAAINHSFVGHAAYLLGEFSTKGWWYYFPFTLVVKTPFATILLLIILMVIGVRTFRKNIQTYKLRKNMKDVQNVLERPKFFPAILSFEHLVLIWTPTIYLIVSMLNNINIGWRHILPIYPFLFILLGELVTIQIRFDGKFFGTVRRFASEACAPGRLAESYTPRKQTTPGSKIFHQIQLRGWTKVFKSIIGTMLIISIAMSLATYPFYLSYFSEIIGGSVNGHKYLLDSNLDWGQDLKRLRSYMLAHDISSVYLAYFGKGDATHYGIAAREIPTVPRDATHEEIIDRIDGVVVISITRLLWEKEYFQFLSRFQPIANIGHSMYIFDLRK